jgi:hypothetical protein
VYGIGRHGGTAAEDARSQFETREREVHDKADEGHAIDFPFPDFSFVVHGIRRITAIKVRKKAFVASIFLPVPHFAACSGSAGDKKSRDGRMRRPKAAPSVPTLCRSRADQ